MLDWTWIAAGLGLVFLSVYLWSSRRAPREKGQKTAGEAAPTTTAAKASEKPPRVASERPKMSSVGDVPRIAYDEDSDVDPTLVGAQAPRETLAPPTQKIVYDEDAAIDEPTQQHHLILLSATAQTDRGTRRKRNEDSILASEDNGLFVVADGMGGYRGGEIASSLAVKTIEDAFSTQSFPGPQHDSIPRRASELARAIQLANQAILHRAERERELEGMGTTVCAARFSRDKQRLYIGHVGDSRVYRLRGGRLEQMTSDHTMSDLGVTGAGSSHLSRAVGVWPTVPIDILLGKPMPGDIYLLCSDGLTKMVTDRDIKSILTSSANPTDAVDALIRAANDSGGKDNISVVVITVAAPRKDQSPVAA